MPAEIVEQQQTDQSVNRDAVVDPNKDGNRADTSRGGGNDQPAKKFEFTEDRSSWVDPSKLKHRFDEVAKRAAKERDDHYKAELEARDRKLRVLAGVEHVDPQSEDDAKVRAELERILGKGVTAITPELLQKLERAIATSESAEAATRQVWEDRAETMVSAVEDGIADHVGGNLTKRQQRDVRRMYRDAAEEAAYLRQSDPSHDASSDFLSRHERGDKGLIKELVDAFVADWIEPVRRKISSDATSRMRPVPRGDRGRPLVATNKPIDLSKPGAFEDALAAARRDEGRGYRE